MKEENYMKVIDGIVWYRIAGLSKKLGVTDQTIRNWVDIGKCERMEDANGRPWVRLSEGCDAEG